MCSNILASWTRLGLATLLSGLGVGSLAGAPPARPNIVVLVADDWGFTDMEVYGGEIATPNLDALARHGVKFSNFHVAATCSPTRAIMALGQDTGHLAWQARFQTLVHPG